MTSGSTATKPREMDRLFEGLLRAEEDTELLWTRLTHALVCRYCGSNCLLSPGNLLTLFLFVVWQIRRWWHLGKWQQLQIWYSADMLEGKGLPLLYQIGFLDHLWKRKSEGEEKEESLQLLEPCFLPKENPVGQQATTVLSQTPCGSQGLNEGTRTPKQVLMQIPSRSFPTFQTLINLPVRYKTPGSHLQQRKSQLFWGLPSLHSESLEAIFLNSGGSSPWKLSVSPSALFNKLISTSSPNLPLPQCCSGTQLPNPEDVEGTASDPQRLPSPPSLPIPLLPLHLKHLPMDHKEILCGVEQRRVLWVSEDQALHPQPYLQRTTPSKLLPSSEASWDPNLQHTPDPLSASLFYNSSHLRILTRFKSPRKTKKQSENPRVSNPPKLAPSSITISWPEYQGVNCIESLFGSHALWKTTRQSEPHQMVEPPILAPCQSSAPTAEPQETSHLGTPIDTTWASIGHKENPRASKTPLLALCYHLDSLSEPRKISPERRLFVPMKTWEHRENFQSSESPRTAPSTPNLQSGVQGGSPLGEPTGSKSQEACRGNSESPWAFESSALDLPRLSRNRPAHVPSGADTLLKDMQSQENVGVPADSVSPPSLLSASTLESLEKIPKDLQETKEQTENFWTSKSPAPCHNLPLAPVLETPRISPEGLCKPDSVWKDSEHSRNSWASQPPPLAFSSPPVLVLEAPPNRSMKIQFDSDRCEDIQRNSYASEPLTSSSPQHPHARSLGIPDFEPVSEDREQREVCKPDCKLDGTAVEENWIPVPISFSASLSNSGDTDCGFVGKNMQIRELSRGLGPPAVNSLQSVPCSPNPAEDLRIQSDQMSLSKRELLPGAKAALPTQGGDGPEVPSLLGIQAWHWSRQLELRLQKLQQRPTSRAPNLSRLVGSPELGSALGSSGRPSWPPQQAPSLILCPDAPSCHPLQSRSTETQPALVSASIYSLSPQAHKERCGRAEKEPQIKEKMKGKTVAEVSSQGPVHKKAGKNCLGLEEPSNLEMPTSSKRKDNASVLSVAQERENPRKITADHRAGDAGLGSSRVTGKSQPAQASACRASQRHSRKHQCCQHPAFPRQLHTEAAGAQDQRGAEIEAGDTLTPRHCKLCLQTHVEYVSSIPQVAFTRGFQRVLGKFVGIHRPLCNKLTQSNTGT